MSLEKYEAKRNFNKTAEPKGGKSKGKALSFVVQRHHASHLHYDFRLELDGVLKSWAVPKGPSMNPGDKRLAMMVEDHPYDYQFFEGVIPNGEYGAGVVITWDHGTYESLAEDRKQDVKTLHAGLHLGNLKFKLHGQILQGEFALVKLHNRDGDDNSWLLIKHKDEFAVTSKFDSEAFVPDNIKELKNNKTGKVKSLPKHPLVGVNQPAKKAKSSKKQDEDKADNAYKPMLAKLEEKVFDDPNWLYEPKLDGYRAIGYTNKAAALISRNGLDFGNKYEKVLNSLKAIEREAVLDGEIVLEDEHGRSDFQDLQNYASEKNKLTLRYYVFDLLSLDGHDLRSMPLIKRKELLRALMDTFPADAPMQYVSHSTGNGTELLVQAQKEGWEGIIGKDSHSVYENGRRSDRWLKFKIQVSQEAIICGYTQPKGKRQYIGSLILGINQGDEIKYVGNCGTGFDTETLKDLHGRLEPLETGLKPFKDKVSYHGPITWVKPELVCEVFYAEWTADGIMRHPVFKGLRMDKEANNVLKEVAGDSGQLPDEEIVSYGSKKVKLTHQHKLFWKKEGITKGELLHYYKDIAPHILPFLKGKALSMRRQPNGIDDPGFFQKDVDESHLPEWIKTEKLYSESNDKDINYIIGQDEATLLYVVNLGCIEINPWLSNYKTPENPDYVVIDIDPHDVPFTEAVEVALKTKEIFDRMKLKVFIKTSGSKGLHIYCYLGGKYDYDFVKTFAEYVANVVHDELPKTTSVERNPAKRKNKTYIDFLQNRRGQTIAAPYSVRPKPGATVSTPLHWHEVNDSLSLANFTIHTIKDRLANVEDPWQDLHKKKQDLKKGLERMKSEKG
ncbi:DNA ligase D [Mucilaginibacter sp. Bleaf8]|uniref:DNA ligase D n=1 Tax=Mucilaginibacter sp. Bleaf8 TaxID=2834430 RepID=UPI001BD111C1|nr:DNA ligase D [Mucilaginibacter sp. Bleaf8]MBS7563594.1 DNA ligase D [Mucilaginibacter sp. Bleaf8]